MATRQDISELPPALAELAGTVLEQRYQLGRVLGAGGMGAVFEARHLRLDRPVAIKVLRPSYAGESEYIERFLREAKSASKIRHRNVVEILDYGETAKGLVYSVMEFLVGQDLQQLLEAQPDNRLPWSYACGLLVQIASGLKAAHGQGVIHRDIKPANCFLTDEDGEPVVKLVDFGIAKLEGSDRGHTLTGTAQVLGTPSYIAPEMVRTKDPASPQSDIYALGVVAYRMLVGWVPFTADTVFELLRKACFDPVPSLRAQVPEIPPAVEAFVQQMLAKDPAQRPANMQTVRDRLVALSRETVGSHVMEIPGSSALPLSMTDSVPPPGAMDADAETLASIKTTEPASAAQRPAGGAHEPAAAGPYPAVGIGPTEPASTSPPPGGTTTEPASTSPPPGGTTTEPTSTPPSPGGTTTEVLHLPEDIEPERARAVGTAGAGAPLARIPKVVVGASLDPTHGPTSVPSPSPSPSRLGDTRPAVGESTLRNIDASGSIERPRRRGGLWLALGVAGVVATAGALVGPAMLGRKSDAPTPAGTELATVDAKSERSEGPAGAKLVEEGSAEPEPNAGAIEPRTPSYGVDGQGNEPVAERAAAIPSVARPEDALAEQNAENLILDNVEPEDRAAEDIDPRVAEPTSEPEPERKPKPQVKPKPAGLPTDSVLIKRLKRKIAKHCAQDLGGGSVTVKFLVIASGTMVGLNAMGSGASCAKAQVQGTKFRTRSKSVPFKITVE